MVNLCIEKVKAQPKTSQNGKFTSDKKGKAQEKITMKQEIPNDSSLIY